MDPTCMWIVGGCGVAIMGMAAYVVKLHLEIKDLWTARVQELEARLTELQSGESDGESA